MSFSIRSLPAALVLSAALFGQAAHALIVTDGGGNSYDVVTVTDSYNNISALLMEQPWWGDSSLATELAIDLDTQLGTPNLTGTGGPGFARLVDSTYVYAKYFFPSGPSVPDALVFKSQAFTFAIANPVPVPPALALFALPLVGLGFKRRRKV